MKYHAPVFALVMGLLTAMVAAQEPTPAPLTDAERARRDADKVFNFIRFQTVRKPAAEGEAKPPRPPRPVAKAAPAPVPSAPAAATVPSTASAAAIKPDAGAAKASAAAAQDQAPGLAAAPVASNPTAAAPSTVIPMAAAVPAATPAIPVAPPNPPAAAAATAPDDEDDDEVPLKLVSFTAPQLSTELQATMGPSQRNIKVRFTVAADGRVTEAQAQPGTPKRLANVATAAIRQWRFEPLPQARDVDVEIAFKRD